MYITAFLLSFSICVFLLLIGINFSKNFRFSRKGDRHIQTKNISRFGGLAIIVAFFISIYFDGNLVVSKPLGGILIASLFLLIVGIWDDIKEINWKLQLAFQLLASCLVILFGVRIGQITNPFGGVINFNGGIYLILGIILTVVWIIVLTNAMNWIDGIDGASGSIMLIASITLFLLSLKPEVNQPPVAIIASILIGCIAGFLIFNLYPSKIIAGTSGSLFMGFVLATLSIFAGTKIATTILVLSIPLADFVWVIFERIRSKKSIFLADKHHLHHKLLKLGMSQRKINFLFACLTALFSFLALNTKQIGKFNVIIGVIITMLIFLIIVSNKNEKK